MFELSTDYPAMDHLFPSLLLCVRQVGKTNAEGLTLEEAKKINMSLLALGNVISALSESQVCPVSVTPCH